jgi:transposase
MSQKYSPEFKAKAVRLVRDHLNDYESEWAAIKTVAGRMGMTPETLRKWLRRDEIDNGDRSGVTTAEHVENRRLRRENAELRRTNEILKAASSFFAREMDSQHL